MKRALQFITGKEWAMFCAVITAILAELPALADAVQGELTTKEWTPMGLVILVMGFAIRSKVWNEVSVKEVHETAQQHVAAKAESDLRFLAVRDETFALKSTIAQLEAALEAARQGAGQNVVGVPMLLQQPQHPGERQ